MDLNSLRQKILLYGFIGIILIVFAFIVFRLILPLAVFFAVIGVILLLYGFAVLRSKYVAEYKKEIVEGTLKEIFTDVIFNPKAGLSKDVISNTEMIMMGNTYSSDDYISGKYNGISFEQADVLIQQVTSNGKTTSTVTYFRGRWMIFDFNKSFKYDLQVRESSFNYAKKTGGWFSKKNKMTHLDMEDEAFNREFDIYAVDEHEAYYILTPHIIENIKSLAASTDGPILMCFIDNRMHVAINNGKNAFEPPLFGNIDVENEKNKIRRDINLITSFVDEMNLERNYKE